VRKRNVAAGLIALLAGVLWFDALAAATATISPTLVSASISPHHRLNKPYNFTATGKLAYPKQICPKGTKKAAYCVKVLNVRCSGKIEITVRLLQDRLLAKSGQVIASGATTLRPNCTYSHKMKLRKSAFIANVRKLAAHAKGHYVHVAIAVRFLGNPQLRTKSAKVQIVIAKVHAE